MNTLGLLRCNYFPLYLKWALVFSANYLQWLRAVFEITAASVAFSPQALQALVLGWCCCCCWTWGSQTPSWRLSGQEERPPGPGPTCLWAGQRKRWGAEARPPRVLLQGIGFTLGSEAVAASAPCLPWDFPGAVRLQCHQCAIWPALTPT